MGLSATAPILDRGSTPTAADLNLLSAVAEEILQRRFNQRTWLAFQSGVAPEVPLGDEYLFGTATNLRTTVSIPYDFAWETPAAPVGGQVLTHDTTTKVVWVTGYTIQRTLNRQKVAWTPPGGSEDDYWFGYDRPERFEPLAVADIIVEDWEDERFEPPSTEGFMIRQNWDRYGCIRIHNGNRHDLLVVDERTLSAWSVPPYGILALCRTGPTSNWESGRHYTFNTHAGDPLRWHAETPAQWAASLELLEWLVGEFDPSWIRVRPHAGGDTTSVDQASYTGAAPAGTDLFADWMIHQGDLLSVITDLRDGTVTKTVLRWKGVASIPDPDWSGHVYASLNGSETILTLESDATPPDGAGPTEWKHDLIPLTTNLTGGQIVDLLAGAFTVSDAFGAGLVLALAPPTQGSGVTYTSVNVFKPTTINGNGGGLAFEIRNQIWDPIISFGMGHWTDTVDDGLPEPPGATGYDLLSAGLFRTLGGLVRSKTIALDYSNPAWGVTTFGTEMLRAAELESVSLKWTTALGATASGTRNGFIARIPRRFAFSGAISGGVAVHENHPWDQAKLGTPDGLGGPMGWVIGGIATRGIRIDGSGLSPTATAYGRSVFMPASPIEWVLENIDTAGWWATNRAACISGVPEAAKLRTMRLPRVVEHFNDLAEVLNRVVYVKRVRIRDLHRDPLPANALVRPFALGGESPFAVPLGWAAGRYDGDGSLQAWADAWGITTTTSLPAITALQAVDRKRWARLDHTGVGTWKWELELYSYFSPSPVTTTLNGYTFSDHDVYRPEAMRLWFGAAAGSTDYIWISEAEMHAAFDPLGVASPESAVGEEYVPRISSPVDNPSTITGTPPGSQEDTRQNDYFADANLPYRDSNSLGDHSDSWVHVIEESTPFRICAPTGNTSTRLEHVPDPGTTVWEVDEGSTGILVFGPYSARQNPPLNAEAIDGGVQAYPECARFAAPFDILITGTPEPIYYVEWTSSTSTNDKVTTISPEGYEVRAAVVPAGTTIDCAYLQSLGWPEASGYHLQWTRWGNQDITDFLNDA